MVSMYAPDSPFTVYHPQEWWSDGWDPFSYGKDFDFSRPFFEQYAELMREVPRASLFGKNNENSDFTNHTDNAKNCYMCMDTGNSQDTYYSKWMINTKDCCDCYQLEKSEWCYESQYSVNLHDAVYCFLCDQCSNVAFCYDCVDCHDCILSCHMRHKRFCIFNEQLTEDEYRKRRKELNLNVWTVFKEVQKKYEEMRLQTFHRPTIVMFSEQSSGDFVYHCNNVHYSYGVIESQDCTYCYDAGFLRDCMDCYEPAFDCELQYEAHACNRGKYLISASVCYDVHNCFYCDSCHNSKNLFGCIGIKSGNYCILNKQYSKEEYEILVPKIIAHMRKTPLRSSDGSFAGQEWGEFFPSSISPFTYNESLAQDYFPLSKEQVLAHKWQWRDEEDESQKYLGPPVVIADDIAMVDGKLTSQILRCEVTERLYKIIPQELAFYKKIGVPVPRTCPDQRHKERLARTNPRRLFDRSCAKCKKAIRSTFAPDRPEIVYCEECYLASVY